MTGNVIVRRGETEASLYRTARRNNISLTVPPCPQRLPIGRYAAVSTLLSS
jgi:hypothetical protein